MASYTTSEIRSGMKLLLDAEPYAVIENEFVKPGKGQAFNRIKVRNLKTGRTIERTFGSGESIEAGSSSTWKCSTSTRKATSTTHGAGELRAVHRGQGRVGEMGSG